MKIYQIGDKGGWTSDYLHRTGKGAKEYITELIKKDKKAAIIWTWDIIIWEINTQTMFRKEYETIDIKELINTKE